MGGGGVYTTVVVGYTWMWASLGFPTGLVRMAFTNWPMVAGWWRVGGEGAKNEPREPRSGVPCTNMWDMPSPQDKSFARGCAYQC